MTIRRNIICNIWLWLINAVCVVVMVSCNNSPEQVSFREGDLLFEGCATSDFTDAIVEATAHECTTAFSHVGIFTMEQGAPMVLEASPSKGVVLTPLDDFIDGCQEVVTMRIDPSVSASDAVARARKFLGKPYDWEFAADNDCIYCSELVQLSYLYPDGSCVFPLVAMNFRDADGAMPQFWTDLFLSLGKPIPQGQPGTNPNSISASPLLRKITPQYNFSRH